MLTSQIPFFSLYFFNSNTTTLSTEQQVSVDKLSKIIDTTRRNYEGLTETSCLIPCKEFWTQSDYTAYTKILKLHKVRMEEAAGITWIGKAFDGKGKESDKSLSLVLANKLTSVSSSGLIPVQYLTEQSLPIYTAPSLGAKRDREEPSKRIVEDKPFNDNTGHKRKVVNDVAEAVQVILDKFVGPCMPTRQAQILQLVVDKLLENKREENVRIEREMFGAFKLYLEYLKQYGFVGDKNQNNHIVNLAAAAIPMDLIDKRKQAEIFKILGIGSKLGQRAIAQRVTFDEISLICIASKEGSQSSLPPSEVGHENEILESDSDVDADSDEECNPDTEYNTEFDADVDACTNSECESITQNESVKSDLVVDAVKKRRPPRNKKRNPFFPMWVAMTRKRRKDYIPFFVVTEFCHTCSLFARLDTALLHSQIVTCYCLRYIKRIPNHY